MLIRKIIGGLVISTSAAALPAQAQICQTAASGKISLGFNVKPSLVAHSNPIMDTTFNAAGVPVAPGGDGTELLFSFKRTIGTILETAKAGSNTSDNRKAFVQTMLDSFATASGSALNGDAGVLLPLDAREESPELTAEKLLGEGTDLSQRMKPLAVFNRFDLAPDDFAHCGEYRIVYGKDNPGFPAPAAPGQGRFLLIFEASVPNPSAAGGEAGCRPITEFWAGLSGISDTEIAKRLSAFFYEGKTGTLNLPEPVVNYKNYGGDGPRGQVRGNFFMQQPWQLREWLTQKTFAPATASPLAFVRDTVKDNPLAELYQDDVSGPPLGPPQNVASAVTALHGSFVASLSSDIGDNLMSEETSKHQKLVSDLQFFDLPNLALGGMPATEKEAEKNILLRTIALGNDNRFNEHQSVSQTPTNTPGIPDDVIKTKVGSAMKTLLENVAATPSPQVNPQTADVILARAQAGTCAGCHMLSPGEVVRLDSTGAQEVTWPAVATGGFVHVREADRALSPALEAHFLPVRRYILGRHLCLPPPPPAPVVAAAEAGVEAALAFEEVPGAGPRTVRSTRFVDAIVADFTATPAPSAAAAAPAAAAAEQASAIEQLSPVARDALRQRVHRAIAEARRVEQNIPGAFVEVRRPH